jgi:hypothetical protein
MKVVPLFSMVTALACLCGCVVVGTPSHPLTVPTHDIQTHEFAADKGMTMSSVLDTLQDFGYVLETVDKDAGFVTANSPERKPGGLLRPQLIVMGDPLVATTQARATAVIEERSPGVTSVRLNFVTRKRSDGKHFTTTRETWVLDEQTYRAVFDKIGEGIAGRSTSPAAVTPK